MKYLLLVMIFMGLSFSSSINSENEKNKSSSENKHYFAPPKVYEKQNILNNMVKKTEVSGSIVIRHSF